MKSLLLKLVIIGCFLGFSAAIARSVYNQDDGLKIFLSVHFLVVAGFSAAYVMLTKSNWRWQFDDVAEVLTITMRGWGFWFPISWRIPYRSIKKLGPASYNSWLEILFAAIYTKGRFFGNLRNGEMYDLELSEGLFHTALVNPDSTARERIQKIISSNKNLT